MTPGPGIEPGTHWWEASALTAAPTLLPFYESLTATRDHMPTLGYIRPPYQGVTLLTPCYSVWYTVTTTQRTWSLHYKTFTFVLLKTDVRMRDAISCDPLLQ